MSLLIPTIPEIVTADQATHELALAAPQADDCNPAFSYIASQNSIGSRLTMTQVLSRIANIISGGSLGIREMDWTRLRYQHLNMFKSALLEGKVRKVAAATDADSYSEATINLMLSALRGTMTQAWKMGYIGAEQLQRITDVDNVTYDQIPAGRSLSNEEVSALIGVCLGDNTLAGIRDAALIALLCAGPRRAEVVRLTLDGFDLKTNAVNIRRGKGRKDRTTYVPDGLVPLIRNWLEFRGDDPGPLLYPLDRNGNILMLKQKKGMDKPEPNFLTAQAVLYILDLRWKQLNKQRKAKDLPPIESFSPHDFRRTFISSLLDAGVDIVTVCKLAGHSNPNTTARYDRRQEAAKQKAVKALTVTYQF